MINEEFKNKPTGWIKKFSKSKWLEKTKYGYTGHEEGKPPRYFDENGEGTYFQDSSSVEHLDEDTTYNIKQTAEVPNMYWFGVTAVLMSIIITSILLS